MQTLCCFLFHRYTERIALHIASEQRTEEQRHASRDCDHKENRNRSGKDQQFPSKGHQVMSLQQLQDRL